MISLLYVGLGGALGSLTRYQIGKLITRRANSSFPVHTLIINVAGAILLGVAAGAGLHGPAWLLAADGFLGAFTTFSTFMYGGFNLFKGQKKINALVYIGGTMIIGIAGYLAGWTLAGPHV